MKLKMEFALKSENCPCLPWDRTEHSIYSPHGTVITKWFVIVYSIYFDLGPQHRFRKKTMVLWGTDSEETFLLIGFHFDYDFDPYIAADMQMENVLLKQPLEFLSRYQIK
jgi:hypothetical protein